MNIESFKEVRTTKVKNQHRNERDNHFASQNALLRLVVIGSKQRCDWAHVAWRVEHHEQCKSLSRNESEQGGIKHGLTRLHESLEALQKHLNRHQDQNEPHEFLEGHEDLA